MESIKTGLAAIGLFLVVMVAIHSVFSLDIPHQAPAAAKQPAVPSSSPTVGKHRRGRGVNCECQWNDKQK